MVVFRRENCSILKFVIFFVGFWANPFIASNGGNPKTIRIRGFNRVRGLEFLGPKDKKKIKNGFNSMNRDLRVNP